MCEPCSIQHARGWHHYGVLSTVCWSAPHAPASLSGPLDLSPFNIKQSQKFSYVPSAYARTTARVFIAVALSRD